MGLFRKRPVVIEAMQWPGYDSGSVGAAQRERVFEWLKAGGCAYLVAPLQIQTLEGTMTASPGDWIIKGVNGEFYPCRPDIFEKTYEAVSEVEDFNPAAPPWRDDASRREALSRRVNDLMQRVEVPA